MRVEVAYVVKTLVLIIRIALALLAFLVITGRL